MSLHIRLARPMDAVAIHTIYAPIVAETPISFELEPPTVEDLRQRIVKTLERYPWLVCVDGDALLGYVYATAHRERAAYQWSVDVSVYMHPEQRRRGLGKTLYSSLFAILRRQGFVNAYAGITLPNPGSVAIHESLGFRLIGVYEGVGYKFDAWRPVGWWHLQLQAQPAAPQPPLALSQVGDLLDRIDCLDAETT